MCNVLCRESADAREIEAGAAAGTKAFCKRNRPKKQMHLESPTDDTSESADGGATPPTPQAKKNGYAAVGGTAPTATPARHAQHPRKSAAGTAGVEVLAMDKGRLSGVVGWEASDGKTMRLCMDRLMQPRRLVLKENGRQGHDTCTEDNV